MVFLVCATQFVSLLSWITKIIKVAFITMEDKMVPVYSNTGASGIQLEYKIMRP
jgi:hypothetical protein